MEKVLTVQMQASLLKALREVRRLDSEDLLTFILKEVREVLNVERVSVFRVDNELDECRLIMGEPKEKHGLGQRFPFDSQKHLKKAVETKSWFEKPEPGLDPEMWRIKELVYTEGITDMAVLPIMIDNEVEWLMVVDAKWPRTEFTDEEKDFCLSMADLAGLLLERDKRQKEMDEKETLLIMGKVVAEAVDRLRNPSIGIAGFARRLTRIIEGTSPQKSPLQIIRKLARKIGGVDYHQFCLTEMLKEVLELERTIDGLVRFSRSKKTNIKDVNVNEIILEVYGLLDGKNIRFNLNLDSELPTISADPADIKEVFYPIMRNAVEAIQKEGEIRIKSICQDCWIKVSVSNSGGIDEEILQEIFNPFFTTKPGAVGLGLATAITTIKAYGGEIKVENDKVLNLTTFVVKFPLPVS